MYDLNTHFKLSEQIILDAHRKAVRYRKISNITRKLKLARLTKHYSLKGLEISIAALKLCMANLELLQFDSNQITT